MGEHAGEQWEEGREGDMGKDGDQDGYITAKGDNRCHKTYFRAFINAYPV